MEREWTRLFIGILTIFILPTILSAYQLGEMTRFDSDIRNLVWLEPSDKMVYVVTELGHLWRSTDAGTTWTDCSMAKKLEGALDMPGARGSFEAQPGVVAIHYHPDKPNKLFFRGGLDYHWITEDNGETFKRVQGPSGQLGLMTIRFHPLETDWFLATARRWSCWDVDRSTCADDLFLTQDFGKTWKNLTEAAGGRILSFVDFDWGWSKEAKNPKHNPSYHKETILATVYENNPEVLKHIKAQGGTFGFGWDSYVDFVRSDNFFKSSHDKVIECGNQFEIMDDLMFLAVASSCKDKRQQSQGNFVNLEISTDYGATFTSTCFPLALKQKGYSVVYASNKSVYVNVDAQQSSRAVYGSLFNSDSSLSIFTQNLRHNARSLLSSVDFAPVQGIPGVFIANQVYQYDDPDLPKYMKGSKDAGYNERTMNRMATVITYNGGASWQTVKPPAVDSEKKPIKCAASDGCGLHLHGSSNWDMLGGGDIPGFAYIYSHISTPGMVMSTGNVGRYLYQDSEVNTYLSRDGGQTWEEVAKGANIYEFGDSGGVIVRAKHFVQGSTDEVLFSLDEGLSWSTLKLQEAIDIYNIRVESENEGRVFLVQGLEVHDDNEGIRHAVVIPIDFTKGSMFKTCTERDYEMWSPSANGNCIMGEKITLQRQVRTSACWNGEDYKRPDPVRVLCNCTVDDYECEFGNERSANSNECVAIPGANTHDCPAMREHSYVVSATHKRLIPGTQCMNPLFTAADIRSRRSGHGLSMWGWIGFMMTGFFVTVVFGFGFLLYKGEVPESIMRSIPFLDNLRYRNLSDKFTPFNNDFGLGGDDDDYVEFRR